MRLTFFVMTVLVIVDLPRVSGMFDFVVIEWFVPMFLIVCFNYGVIGGVGRAE
jgi:hypothetical protein